MTEKDAHEILSKYSALEPGKFYGTAAGLSLGVGLIFESIRCPVFAVEERLFMTVENTVYVLTHECDVDPANTRTFNKFVTICPLIPLSDFLQEYEEQFHDGDRLKNFLTAIARREVSRVVYIPPGPNRLGYGALMYLNNLANTHVMEFDGVSPLAAVSVYGLQTIDGALYNHLLRPKAERLSFQN